MICELKTQGFARPESLSDGNAALAPDTCAVVDRNDARVVRFLDTNAGRPVGEDVTHDLDVVHVALSQNGAPPDRRCAFVDANRDVYVVPVLRRGADENHALELPRVGRVPLTAPTRPSSSWRRWSTTFGGATRRTCSPRRATVRCTRGTIQTLSTSTPTWRPGRSWSSTPVRASTLQVPAHRRVRRRAVHGAQGGWRENRVLGERARAGAVQTRLGEPVGPRDSSVPFREGRLDVGLPRGDGGGEQGPEHRGDCVRGGGGGGEGAVCAGDQEDSDGGGADG